MEFQTHIIMHTDFPFSLFQSTRICTAKYEGKESLRIKALTEHKVFCYLVHLCPTLSTVIVNLSALFLASANVL